MNRGHALQRPDATPPLVHVVGALTSPAKAVVKSPKGYAAEVKASADGKTMVLSVYKPGLILIFE